MSIYLDKSLLTYTFLILLNTIYTSAENVEIYILGIYEFIIK
jgi:hypothetical protein